MRKLLISIFTIALFFSVSTSIKAEEQGETNTIPSETLQGTEGEVKKII